MNFYPLLNKKTQRPDNKSTKSRCGALLFGYAFIALTFLTVVALGLSRQSGMDDAVAKSHGAKIQAHSAAQSGLEYGMAYLRHNQASDTPLFTGEVFLHSFGDNYDGKQRYLTAFKLDSIPRGNKNYTFPATTTTLLASCVLLLSRGVVYEHTVPIAGDFSSTTLAVVRIERECYYTSSPSFALFGSQTYKIP